MRLTYLASETFAKNGEQLNDDQVQDVIHRDSFFLVEILRPLIKRPLGERIADYVKTMSHPKIRELLKDKIN